MSKKKVRVGPNAQITIERCNGRLNIRGGASGVIVYESKRAIDIEQVGNEVIISSLSDCTISVPQTAPIRVKSVSDRVSAKVLQSLRIDHADRDVKAENISAGLSVGSVRGKLEVKKSKSVSAVTVGGYVTLKEISGPVQISTVQDNFSVRECAGKIEVRKVHGDVYASGVQGELKLDSVEGEGVLQGPLLTGKHHLIAAGDVIVHWPPQNKVQFLVTHSGKLFNNLNLKYDVSKQGEFQAMIGDDSCKLIIDSKGDVFLWPADSAKRRSKSKDADKSKSKSKRKKDLDLDLDDLLDPEELIEKVGKGLKSMVKGRKRGKGKGLFGKIFNGAMREVDEWAGVPEERARREQAGQTNPPKNAEEKRRIILKMLENGSITVDEATERLKNL